MIRIALYLTVAAGLIAATVLIFFPFQKKSHLSSVKTVATSSASTHRLREEAFLPEPETTPHYGPSASQMKEIVRSLKTWMTEQNPDKKVEEEQQLEALLTDENAAEFVQALPSDLLTQTAFGSAALQRWAMVDPETAANWLLTDPATTDVQRDIIVASWLHQDAAKLNAYLMNLPPGAERESFFTVLSNRALTEKNPVEAITALAQLDNIALRNQELGWAITTWSINDPQAARSWAESIPDSSLRQEMMAWSAVGSAQKNPFQAAQWLNLNVPPSSAKDSAMESIASIWSQAGPQSRMEALNWVAALSTGAAREGSLKAIIQNWNNADPSGLKAWMQNLPNGSLRNDAEIALSKITSTAEVQPTSKNPN